MQALYHPDLPTQASEGAALRAKAMQGYLLELRAVLVAYTPIPPVRLWVLGESDWASQLRQPYGFAWQRTQPKQGPEVLLPRHYPERLLWRLREALVVPIKTMGKPPGQPNDLLDLNLGHAFAQAVLGVWGLRTRSGWADGLLTNYLYFLAVQKALPELYPKVRSWSLLLAQLPPRNSDSDKPKGLIDLLTVQGQSALPALELAGQGDTVLLGLLNAAPLRKKHIQAQLLQLHPALQPWLEAVAGQPTAQPLPQKPIGWEILGQPENSI